MPTFYIIGGARPNFVKIAALAKAFAAYAKSHPQSRFAARIINTGQHYDYLMSKKLFQDLGIPAPYADLEVGSSSHADQTAKIMIRFETLLLKKPADLIIVVGDVNSTMACSLVASKMHIPVAHVESGLRSFDRTMPEEINRRVTDVLSDYLFTTSKDADQNLIKEGVSPKKIHFVGNVMVDSLLANLHKAAASPIKKNLGLKSKGYGVLTLHRPSNVDKDKDFNEILKAVEAIQKQMPVVFPVHPRTAARMKKGALGKRIRGFKNLILTPPAGYHDFIHLLKDARLVLTDSGGVQEETTVLGVPCLTLRDNTERPVTLSKGCNILAGRKAARIIPLANAILKGSKRFPAHRPPLWDGHAAERIVKILAKDFDF
jgi:UDP-N-acetylglucosamine 2-epimerase (non-hydrolysing)